MATAGPLLSEDHLLCSICLDVFTEPVSIPCGHNFCKACISRHCAGKEQYQCPLCNEKFTRGLKLCVNTGFRDVVENFKKHRAINGDHFPVEAGQVPCDCCLDDNKLKASKTCLVCLTSYCEKHLEPHRRVAALKRHKLTDPVHNLGDKICQEHNRIFELLCINDMTRICAMCTEHVAHVTVPLEEAYVDNRAQTGKKKAEVQEVQQTRSKKAQRSKRKGRKGGGIANSVTSNQMQAPHTRGFPREDPHQLSTCPCLPGNVGLSEGIFFYAVEIDRRMSWDVGIVTESILRTRTLAASRDGNWIIRIKNSINCTGRPGFPTLLHLMMTPKRLIVFVDYDNGLVSFHDVDMGIPVYVFTGCQFRERVFLFLSPSPKEEPHWAQRLRQKVMKAWPRISKAVFVLACASVVIVGLMWHTGKDSVVSSVETDPHTWIW